MKKHKNKIIAGIAILIVLAFAFWYGCDAPQNRGWTTNNTKSTQINSESTPEKDFTAEKNSQTEEEYKTTEEVFASDGDTENKVDVLNHNDEDTNAQSVTDQEIPNTEYSIENGMNISEETGKDEYNTEPVPEGEPVPVEPQNTEITNKELTCTLSVRCDTILNNLSWLNSEKADIVPKDGVIFAEKTVTFYEGESVFNLLLREMKRNKIHMEFENTPIYNSAYIEGIANLYEFDCGELSGWMYKVNNWFPNYGCSRYTLKDGDRVEWVYTCDLGNDVGGGYSAKNGN